MAFTKSNKHELSLDLTKPNEKSGCTLATLYALIVDTRGGTHRIDCKRMVVRVAFHQGVILGIESTSYKE